jgi:UDP-N-acetylmuramyl pentapeptide phosphotransferase/UDP-N-acetylglucosamine-1-phosphate transferase
MVAMYTGLALTVLAVLALVLDLASTGVLAQHLHEVYEGYVSPPDEAAVAAYLFTLGGLGLLGWLWMLRTVRRQKRWARPVATVLFLLASAVALANLTVREYDQTILPIQVGLAGVLPCIAGLVAVILLWRKPPQKGHGMNPTAATLPGRRP